MSDDKPNGCDHLDFDASVGVTRRNHNGNLSFFAEVEVKCRACGKVFDFVGLPTGLSLVKPTVSLEGNVARLPIVPPKDQKPD